MDGTGRAFARLEASVATHQVSGLQIGERKSRSFTGLIASLILLTFSQARAEDIRVRLERVSSSVSLSGVGMQLPGVSSQSSMGFRAVVIDWKSLGAGKYQWRFRDRDSGETLARLNSSKIHIYGSSLRIGLRPVPERLVLSAVPSAPRSADLIATMDLENYLRGVLPAEMPRGWPLEALKAQAVAARTFALFRKAARDRVQATYHVESSVMDQAFRLPVFEEGADEDLARVEQAIRETKGLVLRDHRARAFATYFHSDCGGRTEDAQVVWGEQGVGTAVDGSCPYNPRSKWTAEINSNDLVKRFRGAKEVARVAAVGIEALGQTPSGRISELRIAWSDGTSTDVGGHAFRMAVGHDRVKSANFQVAKNDQGRFVLKGKGYGHGVGLCQWGARQQAADGKSYKDILRHYYPKASLNSLQGNSLQGEVDF